MYNEHISLTLLEFNIVVIVSLSTYPLLFLLGGVVLQAGDASDQAHRVDYHSKCDCLHLRVSVVGEVTDDPEVA